MPFFDTDGQIELGLRFDMTVATDIAGHALASLRSAQSGIASLCIGDRSYSLECLTRVDELEAIKDDWIALERNCADRFNYFQSFDWCYQWCNTKLARDMIERDAALRIYVLRDDAATVMIWPMMETKTRIGARVLTFITDPLAQYSNILVNRDYVSVHAARAIWTLIHKHADVDAISIDRFPSGSFLEAILQEEGFVEKSRNEASILDLSQFNSWDEHHASLSRNQRKQRKRRKSKLKKLGTVTYEICYGGSQEYRTLVPRAIEMKLVWLESTGRSSGILAESDTAHFLATLNGTESGAEGLPEGAVAQALCINGVPIAIEIGMVLAQHYYSYLGAFDWSLRDYSPGKVQIESAQKWAKSAGLEKFDFLGDPADYKEQWTGATHLMHSRSIPKTALGYLYCGIWKSRLRPQLKNVYKNMGVDQRKFSWRVMNLAGKPVTDRNSAEQ